MFQILSIILSIFGLFGFDEWDFAVLMWHMLMLQMIMLEGAKATTETVDALRTGAAAMKAMQKATYVAFIVVLSIFALSREFFFNNMLYFLCFIFISWMSHHI